MRNEYETESVALTLRNEETPELSDNQSAIAMHFPIPPFAANCVHLASTAASIPISSYQALCLTDELGCVYTMK